MQVIAAVVSRDRAPSVIESPKATTVPGAAGSCTSRPSRKNQDESVVV